MKKAKDFAREAKKVSLKKPRDPDEAITPSQQYLDAFEVACQSVLDFLRGRHVFYTYVELATATGIPTAKIIAICNALYDKDKVDIVWNHYNIMIGEKEKVLT